jgi:hypothetical protein
MSPPLVLSVLHLLMAVLYCSTANLLLLPPLSLRQHCCNTTDTTTAAITTTVTILVAVVNYCCNTTDTITITTTAITTTVTTAAQSFLPQSNSANGGFYPDKWIHPKDSVVLEVKCAELCGSFGTSANIQMRFPRTIAVSCLAALYY